MNTCRLTNMTTHLSLVQFLAQQANSTFAPTVPSMHQLTPSVGDIAGAAIAEATMDYDLNQDLVAHRKVSTRHLLSIQYK